MKRFNPFIINIKILRQAINDFCYFNREELVLEVLWSEYTKKSDRISKQDRLEHLTELLWKVADKEIVS